MKSLNAMNSKFSMAPRFGLVWRISFFGVCLAASWVFPVDDAWGKPFTSLEGTSWKIKVAPDDSAKAAGEKAFEDKLIFKGGKFTATTCLKYGYLPSDYHAEEAIGATEWNTVQKSATAGMAAWVGVMHVDTVEGTLTITKSGGKVFHYTFKGRYQNRSVSGLRR